VTQRVVVVGAGVAGLATAYRLSRADDPPDVLVLESDESPGGKVRSAVVGGIELEAGPDSLLARKPWAVELCHELGIGDDLVAPARIPTHVYTEKGLLRFPSGPFGISTDPVELARWPGMSYAGKVRAGGDLVLPRRREEEDESLGSLLRRRIGDEATETLVAPLLGGLFAGDIDRLSVLATFPEIAAWEREHGSITRGARAQAKAAAAHRAPGSGPAPMFLRLRGGLRRLTDTLASSLGGPERLRLGTPVVSVTPDGSGYDVHTDEAEFPADAVVFATPAFVTEQLVSTLAPQALPDLAGIPYVSTAVVLLVYPEGTGDRLPESSGFVSPRGRLPITAATLVSRKWPDPSFGTRAVVRCFIGAWGMEESLALPDDELIERVDDQIAEIFDLSAPPDAAEVVRWPRAMPQYEVGHLDRVARIESALPPGTYVVGQAYRGAGIPDCVRQANETAERVLASLSKLRA
jgi:protoporphyrinogen/coproporphyrinogen III oxidase